MVSAATLAPPGNEVQTFLRCWKRPERKPCSGQISVRLEEEPAQLHWWCTSCGQKGIIKNWKGVMGAIIHTHSEFPSDRADCTVLLSHDEYLLLSEIEVIEPQAKSIVGNAYHKHNAMSITGKMGLFNTILGYIAFEANQSEKISKKIAFDKLLNKIKNQLPIPI
jgi:hypothetical protein